MDICATNIFKSQNRWPWYCFKLCPLFLPSPSIRENRLSENQERNGVSFCSGGRHVAWAVSAPPVRQAKDSGVHVAPGGRGQSHRLIGKCLCGFCLTFPGSLLSVLRSPDMWAGKIYAGDVPSSPAAPAHSLEHGRAAANSFSEEAQRKLRNYCPHLSLDSTTMSIKLNANRRKKKKQVELWS